MRHQVGQKAEGYQDVAPTTEPITAVAAGTALVTIAFATKHAPSAPTTTTIYASTRRQGAGFASSLGMV